MVNSRLEYACIAGGTMMLRRVAIVAGLALTLAAPAEAESPRKGGTIRMTAPYGSSFTSLDIHTTRRALRPRDRGRGCGREGPGQGDLRPEEDRRFHPRDEADREGRSRLLLLHRADVDLSCGRGDQGKFSPEADWAGAIQIRRARAG